MSLVWLGELLTRIKAKLDTLETKFQRCLKKTGSCLGVSENALQNRQKIKLNPSFPKEFKASYVKEPTSKVEKKPLHFLNRKEFENGHKERDIVYNDQRS